MLFPSLAFAIFLPLVLVVYWLLPRRGQNLFLLLASYVFYGWWDWRFCSLLLFSTILDYVCGQHVSAGHKHRRVYMAVSLIGNLGVLGFFKYFNFFVDSAASLLELCGLNSNLPVLQVILPVGISFYTFQTMSYTIDVYRGQMKPCHDLVAMAAYVAFFPQLVAGPIERAEQLLPQFMEHRCLSLEKIESALVLIVFGFFKKLAIADAVAPFVNDVFSRTQESAWPVLILATLFFGLQIYGDFSGYSDIARGVARLMGFELMVNFEQPYFATSIREFWRRWHISLSTWLRDYLYIPMGGNRLGARRTYINLIITMLLGGLWHGASWMFVIWGLLHGCCLAVHRLVEPRLQRFSRMTPAGLYAFVGWGCTMFVVFLAWIFFRSPSISDAWSVLSGIFCLRGAWHGHTYHFVRLAGFILLLCLADIPQRIKAGREQVLDWHPVLRGCLLGFLVVAAVILKGDDQMPFIYFQF